MWRSAGTPDALCIAVVRVAKAAASVGNEGQCEIDGSFKLRLRKIAAARLPGLHAEGPKRVESADGGRSAFGAKQPFVSKHKKFSLLRLRNSLFS